MGGLVLSRGPLPRIVTNSIQSKFPYVAFSSNPCRLRYFTKEIVLVRHRNQLLETHSLLTPLEEYDRTHHTIKTLLDQGHLSPLPLPSQPIYWKFDHSLCLFPLPDAIVLADSNVDSYCQSYHGCKQINIRVLVYLLA
jgi:DNA polymerase epsilon subunit 2